MSDDLDITSGPSAKSMTVQDLEEAARRLVRAGGSVGETARDLALLQGHPLLVCDAVLGPASAVTLALARGALALVIADAVAQSLRLHELGLGTLAVLEARRTVERVVEHLVDAEAKVVAVLLLSSLPKLAVVGVVLQDKGVPVPTTLEALAFAEPGAVQFLADGLVPLLPALIGGVRLATIGSALTERGSIAVLARPARLAPRPHDLGDLIGSGVEIGVGDAATVRVTQVQGDAGPAWIVQVPGTQSWPPHGGPNPHDLTSNALLLTQQQTAVAAGVARALEAAQADAGPGSEGPVMLVGHSQGGMVAAALAASPRFRARHRVTHVVAYGSPISRVPVPEQVQVLALQHRQDAVPRLDGAPDPRRPGWVTVTRDVGKDPGVRRSLLGAHQIEEYAETARAAEVSPSAAMESWSNGASAFLPTRDGSGRTDSTATVRDYVLRRVPPVAPPRASGGSW